MPKSRNRKNRKSYSASQIFHFADLWADQIQSCRSCNFKRYYLEFEELPEEQQLKWKQDENFAEIDFYLYCRDAMNILQFINRIRAKLLFYSTVGEN